ncbi:MAG: outer membrane protein assembly factor BamD [Gammaproteobacteria bacterium]
MRRFLAPVAVLALSAALLAACASGPRKIPPEQVLYKRASNSLTVENWQGAAGQFRALLSTYPFGKYATQARLNLIYAYYRGGQPDEAAKQADEFLKENPASPYAGYALFLKGISYASAMQPGLLDSLFHVGLAQRAPLDQDQAFTAFKQLIKSYPDTIYATKARQWMVFVRDRLARYNLNVARFYMRRQEWVAAVNRAETVVSAFPETPSVKPALKVMVRGYRALGEKKLADAAESWYQFNYGSQRTQSAHAATAPAPAPPPKP